MGIPSFFFPFWVPFFLQGACILFRIGRKCSAFSHRWTQLLSVGAGLKSSALSTRPCYFSGSWPHLLSCRTSTAWVPLAFFLLPPSFFMSVYVRWFWWRLLEIWAPLPATPSLIGIVVHNFYQIPQNQGSSKPRHPVSALVLCFCVYSKMNWGVWWTFEGGWSERQDEHGRYLWAKGRMWVPPNLLSSVLNITWLSTESPRHIPFPLWASVSHSVRWEGSVGQHFPIGGFPTSGDFAKTDQGCVLARVQGIYFHCCYTYNKSQAIKESFKSFLSVTKQLRVSLYFKWELRLRNWSQMLSLLRSPVWGFWPLGSSTALWFILFMNLSHMANSSGKFSFTSWFRNKI